MQYLDYLAIASAILLVGFLAGWWFCTNLWTAAFSANKSLCEIKDMRIKSLEERLSIQEERIATYESRKET